MSITIDEQVLRLFSLVADGLTAATAAFLTGDCASARDVVAGDRSIDALQLSTESLIRSELGRLPQSEGELRTLVATLLIVPELERSGDLVEHIALRTPQGLADAITPRARALVGEMGRVGSRMWTAAADAYRRRDAPFAEELRRWDDELDDLHVDLSAELASSSTSAAVAIEMGLVARFLERLGDHAVNVTRRLEHLEPQPELAA